MNRLILIIQLYFTTLLISQSVLFCQTSSSSSLTLLSERVIELKQIAKDKEFQIKNLNGEIFSLMRSNKQSKKENRQLKKEIESKTEQLLYLDSQLSDLTFDYEKLILELEKLEDKNEDLNIIIQNLNNSKTTLSDSLSNYKILIKSLADTMRAKNYQTELINAKNNKLIKRIEDLVKKPQIIKNIEVYGNIPGGFGFNLMYGRITRGGNIIMGFKTGVNVLGRYLNDYTRNYSFIPVGFDIRIALDKKNKLGFSYVSTEDEQIVEYKWFGILEVNYSYLLKNQNKEYGLGGFGGFLGCGLIFDFNENVKPYLNAGIRFQNLSENKVSFGSNINIVALQLGGGVYL